MDLNQMMVFAKVAEFQSFTKAGKELGIEKSNVSAKVSKLEDRLGVRLLNRTTRTVTLTQAGTGYYQYCKEIQTKIEDADNFAESWNHEPQGTFRVTIPADSGHMIINSLVKPFLEANRKTKIELLLTNRKVDLIKERYDLAIRAGAVLQEDSSYICDQLNSSENALFASPEFLEINDKPRTFEELEKADMIAFASEEAFEQKISVKVKNGKKSVQLSPKYRLKVNDMTSYLESTLSGLGISILPTKFVNKYVESGLLVPVMPELKFPEVGFFVIYPSSPLVSIKLKTFLEYLKNWEPTL